MYVKNGIVYAGELIKGIEVAAAVPLNDMMILITFNTGEKRLYDAAPLLDFQAFQPLKDQKTFKSFEIERGVLTWCDGEIDIAPETVYKDSFPYSDVV